MKSIHLFEWPSRHNVHLALPIMLVLSFLLHAACMFIFHATFPRSEGSRERSATVYIFCRALRKRPRSLRCWRRQTQHCSLPQRFLDATFRSFLRPPTLRASTKKFLCSRPCRLRLPRNFFRLLSERRGLPWQLRCEGAAVPGATCSYRGAVRWRLGSARLDSPAEL